MRPCVVAFPCSVGDQVCAYGDPGWAVVGLCASDKGRLVMVRKGLAQQVVALGAITEEVRPK